LVSWPIILARKPLVFNGPVLGEGYIARLLQRMGLETEETARTGDGGVDIVARSDAPINGGVFIVQRKRCSSPVGEPVVRNLYGALNQIVEPW
jgi:restriction endonuclease Mrr